MSAASMAHAAAPNASALLCNDVGDAFKKNPALQTATRTALGTGIRIQPDDASGACTTPAALLTFGADEILITGEADRGGVDADDVAHLSAYFLSSAAGGAMRLTGEKRRFADSPAPWGRAGDISAAHFGPDNGMIVTGDGSMEGFSTKTALLFVFHPNQVVRLGSIPLAWGNGGAEDDASKEVSIRGHIESGAQADRVRVTYTRKAGAHTSTVVSIWRSSAGRFVLEAGSVPKEIVKSSDLPPSAFARNGSAIPASDMSGWTDR